MRKSYLCPRCNVKMKPVMVKRILNVNSPEMSGYQASDFVAYGGNVEAFRKELRCPNCSRQMTSDRLREIHFISSPKKVEKKLKKPNKSQGKGKKVWKVLLILFIIAVVLAGGAFVLYKTGHMPQSIINFVKSIMPDRLVNFFITHLA